MYIRDRVYAALHEQGEVLITDDICQREYRFDAQAIAKLFAGAPSSAEPPTLH